MSNLDDIYQRRTIADPRHFTDDTRCHDCGLWLFHTETAPRSNGKRYCAPCWTEAVERAATRDQPHQRTLSKLVPYCTTCQRDAWDCRGTDRCIDCGTLQIVGDEGREECPQCREEEG